MYLTDLAFIEEGTPNYTEDGLVNFSKMRMVSFPAGAGGRPSPDLSPRATGPAPPGTCSRKPASGSSNVGQGSP